MGPCAGGAVYSPAITDFNIMVEGTSYMFVTGPDVIKTVTHEEVTKEAARRRDDAQRDRAASRTSRSRTIASACSSSASCSAICPSNNVDDPPRARHGRSDRSRGRGARSASSRESPNQPYDMHDLVQAVADDGAFLEVHRHYAKNIIVGFARLGGRSVGIVANQPAHLAGTLDIDASVKAARFVRFCDAFNIPLVTFEDVPGFPPGHAPGVRRHHPARREAALRVCRSHGAEGDRDHAQGLRRRVLRHVEQAHSHRRQLRVADGRDRGHGAGGGGEHPLQARDRERAPDPATRRARERVAEFRREVRQPVRRRLARLHRRSDPAAADPRQLIAALARLETKRDKNPPKKHGNIPL